MKLQSCYLGIDVGSVSTNIVAINENNEVIEKLYIKTAGNPVNAIKEGLNHFRDKVGNRVNIIGCGVTGSGRQLASILVGADIVKNEITAHAIAAKTLVPEVSTILEIGGQDSKIILIRDGVVQDFAMNTVCAAGTGSFLDRQAERLRIPIEELGEYALKSTSSVRIAGRCAVFAESDMIHKQQTGHSNEDIICGLCDALARNFLSNLAKGKNIEDVVVFQGGVAANVGMIASFEKLLGKKIVIPKYHDVMGALGVAVLAKENNVRTNNKTKFYGFEIVDKQYNAKSIECQDCPNQCEIVEMYSNDVLIARWGDKCGKWSQLTNVV